MDLNILLPLNLIGQFFSAGMGSFTLLSWVRKWWLKEKDKKIIQNADTEAMFTVLLAGFAAHFKFTNRQVIYQNHLLQK